MAQAVLMHASRGKNGHRTYAAADASYAVEKLINLHDTLCYKRAANAQLCEFDCR